MTAKLTGWFADVREHRLAVIIAVVGSLVLMLLLIVPSWFILEDKPVHNKKIQAHTPSYKLPPRLTHTSVTKSKTDVKPAPPTSTPAIHKNGKKIVLGYYVQAGAFKDTARAKKIADSLQNSGWDVRTVIKENNLHAVLIGPWATRTRAQEAKQKLAHQNKLQGFIVTK